MCRTDSAHVGSATHQAGFARGSRGILTACFVRPRLADLDLGPPVPPVAASGGWGTHNTRV